MSDVPEDLRYTQTHEWIRTESDGSLTIGITYHAQELLGDLVFVELPEVGGGVTASEECVVIESVKAASDMYAPVSGEITAVNEDLADSPQVINEDPYGDGWILKIQPSDPQEVDELMDADAYSAHQEADDH